MLDSIPGVSVEIADGCEDLRTFTREDVPSNHAFRKRLASSGTLSTRRTPVAFGGAVDEQESRGVR